VTFTFDPEAIAAASELEHEHFPVPNFGGLSDLVMDYPENPLRVIPDSELHRTYFDALNDLHLLVEEYRFSALLAVTLLRDYSLKRERGDAPPTPGAVDARFDNMAWPVEVVAVMRGYATEPPNAAELFEDPHQQMSGNRILSRWFAAQLIDSALYRGIAACDRMAILLRCQAGLPVKVTSKGERRQPSFSKSHLKALNSSYATTPVWKRLVDLATSPLFEFVRQERNGFTHERRRPSELHGERAIVYGSQGSGPEETVFPLDAASHYALAPAFYNEVLCKALAMTRELISESAKKTAPPAG
jgi:hypothetical protein